MNLNCSGYQDRSESYKLTTDIKTKSQRLFHHPVYNELTSMAKIECFMSYHIFAVWDFIKLLKALQNKLDVALREQFLECSSEMKNLINEMIFTQDSELYPYGQPNKHFMIYLRIMIEMEIAPIYLWSFLEAKNNLHLLKPGIQDFIETNSEIARSEPLENIAAIFLFGQEKITFTVFSKIITLLQKEARKCPILIEYTDTLIQVSSDQSSILPLKLLDCLCQNETKKVQALQAGLAALNRKEQLWNYALIEMANIT